MNQYIKGSDLLSARVIAITGLIIALGNIGLGPLAVVTACMVLIYMLK